MKWGYWGFLAVLVGGCSTQGGAVASRAAPDGVVSSNQTVLSSSYKGVTLDSQDRKMMERLSPRTVDRMDRGEPLTLNDVIKLSQGGVDDGTVMNYMKDTHSAYNLSQAQIRRLQDAGVSQRVVSYMVDSGR